MGKRNLRYLENEIPEKLGQLIGKSVQVVKKDQTTYSGTLREANETDLLITDPNMAWYNRKKHSHRIPITDIREVIADQVTDF